MKFHNLKKEMVINNKDTRDMSKLLNISEQSFRCKMSGSRNWRKSEIDKICKLLKKDYEYLFSEEVV